MMQLIVPTLLISCRQIILDPITNIPVKACYMYEKPPSDSFTYFGEVIVPSDAQLFTFFRGHTDTVYRFNINANIKMSANSGTYGGLFAIQNTNQVLRMYGSRIVTTIDWPKGQAYAVAPGYFAVFLSSCHFQTSSSNVLSYGGLFQNVSGTIRGTIIKSQITAEINIFSLAASSFNLQLINATFEGIISGTGAVAGISKTAVSSTFKNIQFNQNVTGKKNTGQALTIAGLFIEGGNSPVQQVVFAAMVDTNGYQGIVGVDQISAFVVSETVQLKDVSGFLTGNWQQTGAITGSTNVIINQFSITYASTLIGNYNNSVINIISKDQSICLPLLDTQYAYNITINLNSMTFSDASCKYSVFKNQNQLSVLSSVISFDLRCVTCSIYLIAEIVPILTINSLQLLGSIRANTAAYISSNSGVVAKILTVTGEIYSNQAFGGLLITGSLSLQSSTLSVGVIHGGSTTDAAVLVYNPSTAITQSDNTIFAKGIYKRCFCSSCSQATDELDKICQIYQMTLSQLNLDAFIYNNENQNYNRTQITIVPLSGNVLSFNAGVTSFGLFKSASIFINITVTIPNLIKIKGFSLTNFGFLLANGATINIENVVIKGKVGFEVGTSTIIGGFVGITTGAVTVKTSSISGELSGSKVVGGFIGQVQSLSIVSISGSLSWPYLSVNQLSGALAGGFIGVLDGQSNFANCQSNGSISGFSSLNNNVLTKTLSGPFVGSKPLSTQVTIDALSTSTTSGIFETCPYPGAAQPSAMCSKPSKPFTIQMVKDSKIYGSSNILNAWDYNNSVSVITTTIASGFVFDQAVSLFLTSSQFYIENAQISWIFANQFTQNAVLVQNSGGTEIQIVMIQSQISVSLQLLGTITPAFTPIYSGIVVVGGNMYLSQTSITTTIAGSGYQAYVLAQSFVVGRSYQLDTVTAQIGQLLGQTGIVVQQANSVTITLTGTNSIQYSKCGGALQTTDWTSAPAITCP